MFNFVPHKGKSIPEFPENTRFVNVRMRNCMVACLIINTASTRWEYEEDSTHFADIVAYEIVLE